MICIPITAGKKKEALHAIERSCQFADFIELRMDLIEDGSLAELISTARDNSSLIKIIVTCRKKEEVAPAGGTAGIKSAGKKTMDRKIALLKEAIELGADFVDIELSEGKVAIGELRDYCTKRRGVTGIIISYHDIRKTPALTRLKEIFHQCL